MILVVVLVVGLGGIARPAVLKRGSRLPCERSAGSPSRPSEASCGLGIARSRGGARVTVAQILVLLVRYGLVVLFLPASALDKILNFKGAVKQAKQVFSSNAVAVTLILVGVFVEPVMPGEPSCMIRSTCLPSSAAAERAAQSRACLAVIFRLTSQASAIRRSAR